MRDGGMQVHCTVAFMQPLVSHHLITSLRYLSEDVTVFVYHEHACPPCCHLPVFHLPQASAKPLPIVIPLIIDHVSVMIIPTMQGIHLCGAPAQVIGIETHPVATLVHHLWPARPAC